MRKPTIAELKALAKAAARPNFWAFCCYWDWDFFYTRRRVLKKVADALQRVYEAFMNGARWVLGISTPPRAGKSYIVSLFCLWWLGNLNASAVMRCTCTAELYNDLSRQVRAMVLDPRFAAVFPETALAKDARSVKTWRLTTSIQNAYFGAGVGGTIIGKGATIGITDDLYRGHADALSETRNALVWQWKQSAFDSRLEADAPQVHVGTRWTEDDVLGGLAARGMLTEYLRLPAVDKDGRSFCEDVKTTEEYAEIRRGLRDGDRDGFIWLSEYMQNPVDPKGYLYPLSALKFADLSRRVAPVVERVCFVDPADDGEDGFVACFVDIVDVGAGLRANLRDVVAISGAGVEAGSELVVAKACAEGTDKIFIEANGVGSAAYMACRRGLADRPGVTIQGYKEKENKITRIILNHEDVKRYVIFARDYESRGDYAAFMAHLTRTPARGLANYGHRKDPADCLSNVTRYMKARYSEILNGTAA